MGVSKGADDTGGVGRTRSSVDRAWMGIVGPPKKEGIRQQTGSVSKLRGA